MGRPNYRKLAKQVYRLNPKIDDCDLLGVFDIILGLEQAVELSTIAVWKSAFRKVGIPIPDERRKK